MRSKRSAIPRRPLQKPVSASRRLGELSHALGAFALRATGVRQNAFALHRRTPCDSYPKHFPYSVILSLSKDQFSPPLPSRRDDTILAGGKTSKRSPPPVSLRSRTDPGGVARGSAELILRLSFAPLRMTKSLFEFCRDLRQGCQNFASQPIAKNAYSAYLFSPYKPRKPFRATAPSRFLR
jgi:hypothetical protein